LANDYFNETGAPADQSSGDSSVMRSEFTEIGNGFDKLPGLTGNGNKTVVINAGGTAQTVKTAAEMRTLLAVQPLDTGLTSIAGLTTAADKMIYTDGSDSYVVTPLTAAGRNLLDDASNVAQLVTLGLTATATEIDALAGVSANIVSLLGAADYGAALTLAGVSRKNLIINGNFNIWQRGTSFTSVASVTYTADRFNYQKTGAMVHDIAQSSDTPTSAESGYNSTVSLHATLTTPDDSLAAGDLTTIKYTLEGYDYAPLEGQTAALSFWVKATTTGTYCINFRNSANDRSYIVEYTIDTTNTWEKKVIPITFDYSGGTWDLGDGIGLKVTWVLAAGTNWHGAADTWLSTGDLATSSQVNGVATGSTNFRLSQVQLEVGSDATQLEHRAYGEELALCQRYFCKTFPQGTAPAQSAGSTGALAYRVHVSGQQNDGVMWKFPVIMRTTPTTITYYSTGNASAFWWNSTRSLVSAVGASTGESDSGIFVSNAGVAGDNAKDLVLIHATAEAEL